MEYTSYARAGEEIAKSAVCQYSNSFMEKLSSGCYTERLIIFLFCLLMIYAALSLLMKVFFGTKRDYEDEEE